VIDQNARKPGVVNVKVADDKPLDVLGGVALLF
jgi:hypothetical protein